MQELNCVEVNSVSGGGELDIHPWSILKITNAEARAMSGLWGEGGSRGPLKESVEDSLPPENL